MGYSIKYIKYIKYSGLGMDSNQFWMILNNFGQFWSENIEQNSQHFLKMSFSYESSGQTPKPKRLVYGSSSYELFKENVDSPGKLQSKLNFFSWDRFFI